MTSDTPTPTAGRTEIAILRALPDEADGGVYYCDIDVDYRALERLEQKGLATSHDRSDWWRTTAGKELVTNAR